ncbi:hypothetical protein ACFQ6Q_31285 [Streptomyces sp. NPDC056437]|uniref:hypothetical protein n=1 Tax=Streptomyces sp. NPDC056437 TaxID=3345816 RepID=UPI00368562F9
MQPSRVIGPLGLRIRTEVRRHGISPFRDPRYGPLRACVIFGGGNGVGDGSAGAVAGSWGPERAPG